MSVSQKIRVSLLTIENPYQYKRRPRPLFTIVTLSCGSTRTRTYLICVDFSVAAIRPDGLFTLEMFIDELFCSGQVPGAHSDHLVHYIMDVSTRQALVVRFGFCTPLTFWGL